MEHVIYGMKVMNGKLLFFYCYSYLYSASITDRLFTESGDGLEPWREISHDIEFSGYCVAAVYDLQPNLISMGNLKGYIKLFSISEAGLSQCVVKV